MKLNELIKRTNQKNKYFLPVVQGLGAIALITAISVISVHFLTGDSLSDYAEANPEKAYAGRTIEELQSDATPTAKKSGADAGTEHPRAEEKSATDAGSEIIRAEKKSGADSKPDGTKETELTGMAESADSVDITKGDDATADGTPDKTESADDDLVDITCNYVTSAQIHFYDPDNASSPDRVTYSDGFYYEPLNEDMITYVTGTSYPADGASEVTIDDLRYVGIKYVDFNGTVQAGELMANRAIAQDLVEIFSELYESGYQLERVVLIDNYGGDDTASMSANNTSCFNYRVVEGSSSLSKHAYGLAMDVNPYYNPYVVFGKGEGGSDYVSPPGSDAYADRSASFAYKIDENDLCYRLFKEHGFTWGGDWNSCKDYQHFQKTK